ncbi:MAG: ABC transporter substrate binding protein [Cyanobacteria bacterium P01_A01_bin.40]
MKLITKQKIADSKIPIVLFLICSLIFFTYASLQKPRVLILHSYSTSFAWVRDINVGIQRVLAKQPYKIQYYYMDTKRNPDPAYKAKVAEIAKQNIIDWEPNVIIAIDDNAQSLVAKEFINNPKIKIVFTGVNAEPETYGYDTANNVSGLLERIPFDSIKEAFVQILPENRRRIVHYSDSSPTSDAVHLEMDNFNWEPIELIEHVKLETFAEWQQAILNADRKADFLFLTHYHTLKRSAEDPSTVSPQEVMAWTMANSPLPDIGCWGFYVDDGGMLALGVSPYEEGEVAAQMTVDILEHDRSPQDLGIKTSRLYVSYARESRLQKYQIQLPKVYESFARATNNYYE